MQTSLPISSGQSYLQLLVPLDRRCQWYRRLKSMLGRMQPGGFHITVAFISDGLDQAGVEKVADILDKELRDAVAPVITFDKLDAFTKRSGDQHIVNLTASVIPSEFTDLKDRIRSTLVDNGYQLQGFTFHVTLARVDVNRIDLQSLQDIIGTIDLPPITRTLKKASYCFQHGHEHPIRRWVLPSRQ